MISTEGLPRLVLLPGLLNDGRLWSAQVQGLSGTAQCYIGDLTGADTIAALAQSVLRQAPPGRFALAGLSMGGYVALEIMRQAPERITALALLDTSARPDNPQTTEGRHTLMKLSETDFPGVIETLKGRLMLPQHAMRDDMGGLFRKMANDVGPQAFLRQERAIMSRIDSLPFLPRITCPTLVLCGREDGVTPVAVHEEMKAAIPGSQSTILKNCGHLSALEQSGLVLESMIRWLGRVASDHS